MPPNDESAKIISILSDFKNNIFVRACAGSGKTRLLAAKYLIALFHFKSSQKVAAITFTEKAALELKSRIQKFLTLLVESSSERELELREDIPWPQIREAADNLGIHSLEAIRELALVNKDKPLAIGTIHGFAKRILDAYPIEVLGGVCSEFEGSGETLKTLLEEVSSDAIVEEIKNFKAFSFRQAASVIQELLDCVKRGLGPDYHLKTISFQQEKIRDLWQKFLSLVDQAILKSREEGYLDYDLMLYWLDRFLKRVDPETLTSLRDRFRYVLLDELQDTDFLQFEILLKLAGGHRNQAEFFMVGDPLQSIYAFRGAHPELGFQYAERAGFLQYELLGNKRSGSKVLGFINAVYAQERPMETSALEKKPDLVWWHPPTSFLRIRSDIGANPLYSVSESRRLEEAKHVACAVYDLARKHGWQWKDFAVLMRKMTHGWIYQEAFREAGIPTILAASEPELFQRSLVVREIFWLTRLYLNPEDLLARFYLESSPLMDRHSSFEVFYLKPVEKLRESLWESASAGAVVSQIRETFELEKKAFQISFDETRALSLLEELSWREDVVDTEFFLKRLRTLLEKGDLGEDEFLSAAMPWGSNAVKIITIHQAKGLEFPCVLLAGLGDWSLRRTSKKILWDPQRKEAALVLPGADGEQDEEEALKSLKEQHRDREIREEERVLYVALTRAQAALVIFEPDLPKGPRGHSWTPKIKAALEKAKNKAESFECSLCQNPNIEKLQQKGGAEPSLFRFWRKLPTVEKSASALVLASEETEFHEFPADGHKREDSGENIAILGRIVHRVLEQIPWKAEIPEGTLSSLIQGGLQREEAVLGKPEPSLAKEAKEILEKFFRSSLWRELVSKRLLLREMPVCYWAKPSLVIGRIDLVYEDNPQRIVVADYKTEALNPRIYLNQGNAYVEALKTWMAARGYQEALFEIIDLKSLKRTRLLP